MRYLDAPIEPQVIDRYRQLITALSSGHQTVNEFVDSFLIQWRSDRDDGRPVGEAIDNFMTAVDCYSPTPVNSFTIDEDQLRTEAAATLDALG